MYKLLIIDDEKLMRQGLVDYIDWAELSIEIIGTAKNGEEALILIEDKSPDIILSDIRMPRLNGIELIKKLRLLNLNTQVIFISAYSEFSYAQSALKWGAFDYLLKPIEEDVLYQCIQNCIEKKLQTSSTPTEDFNEIRWATLEKHLFEYILNTKPFANEALLLSQQLLGTDFFKQPNYLLTVYSSAIDALPKVSSLLASIPELKFCSVKLSKHLHLFLLSILPDEGEPASALLKEQLPLLVHDFCIKNFTLDVLPLQFHKAQLQLLVNQKLLTCIPSYKSIPCLDRRVISDAMSDFNKETLTSLLQQQLQVLIEREVFLDLDKLQYELKLFLSIVYDELEHIYGHLTDSLSTGQMQILSKITDYNNFFEMIACVDQTFGLLTEELLQFFTSNQIVSLSLQYIHKNYFAPITLYDVAEHIHVSSSYLSKLFKHTTGDTFSNYLITYRIKKSQKLLAERELKIYEISARVGYPDVVQFTKMFKKVAGVSPSKWLHNSNN